MSPDGAVLRISRDGAPVSVPAEERDAFVAMETFTRNRTGYFDSCEAPEGVVHPKHIDFTGVVVSTWGDRRKRRARTGLGSLPLLAVAALAACGGDGEDPGYTVIDSAGIEIVESASPGWGDSAAWTVASEPALRIGDGSGDPRYELYGVRAVHRLPDGRIVVANGGTRQLRFYGPDGTWLSDAAGEGEGPGELRQINAMFVAGDSILVYDLALNRVTVFDDRGAYARSFRLPQAPDGPAPALAGRLADGHLVLRQQVRSWMVHPEPGVQPIRVRYLLAAPDGTVRRDLGEFERAVHLVRVYEDRRVSMGVLWGRSAYFATTAAGFLYGSGARHRVLEYDTTGTVGRIVRLDRSPEPVRSGELDAWIDSVAARSDDPAATRQWLRERYDGVDLPDTKPTWVDLRTGPAGDLWLREYAQAADGPERWTVFDSAGAWLGTLTMPERFDLHQVGADLVLGVARDELDMEVVELYPLDRGHGSQ